MFPSIPRLVVLILALSLLFVALIVLSLASAHMEQKPALLVTADYHVFLIDPSSLVCSDSGFSFNYSETYAVPQSSQGPVMARIVVNLSTGYSHDTGKFIFAKYKAGSAGLSGNSISDSGYVVPNDIAYRIMVTRYIYVGGIQFSVNEVIAICGAGPVRVMNLISTINANNWGLGKVSGVYQGVIPPTNAQSRFPRFKLRMVTCDTSLYKVPPDEVTGGYVILTGQVWFIDPTPFQASGGERWVAVFVPDYGIGFIPARCLT